MNSIFYDLNKDIDNTLQNYIFLEDKNSLVFEDALQTEIKGIAQSLKGEIIFTRYYEDYDIYRINDLRGNELGWTYIEKSIKLTSLPNINGKLREGLTNDLLRKEEIMEIFSDTFDLEGIIQLKYYFYYKKEEYYMVENTSNKGQYYPIKTENFKQLYKPEKNYEIELKAKTSLYMDSSLSFIEKVSNENMKVRLIGFFNDERILQVRTKNNIYWITIDDVINNMNFKKKVNVKLDFEYSNWFHNIQIENELLENENKILKQQIEQIKRSLIITEHEKLGEIKKLSMEDYKC